MSDDDDDFFQTGLANTVIDKPNPRTNEQQMQDVLEFLCTDTVW